MPFTFKLEDRQCSTMGAEPSPLLGKILKEPIQFKPLSPSLSFIKNKKMWSGSIRTAMREIPEEDYQKIIGAENLR
jgi:hypothetical protein